MKEHIANHHSYTVNSDKIFPVIRTSRLLLRQLTEKDAPHLHAIWSDPVTLEFMLLDPFKNIEETLGMINLLRNLPESGEGARWVITLASDGFVMGTCGFHNWKKEHARAEVGYELGRNFWRMGYMTEALEAILEYGFEEMELNRVEALVTDGNEKSLNLLKKLEFNTEGCLRQYEWARGKFQDQWICSLLKSQWRANRMK